MSLNDLKRELQTDPRLFNAVANANLLSARELAELKQLLLASYGLTNVDELRIAALTVADQTDIRLKVTGNMTVLQQDTKVTIVFTLIGNRFDFIIQADATGEWSFNDSFSSLPRSPLDDWQLEQPSFLFTTTEVTDYEWFAEHKIPLLKKGQNLAALVRVNTWLFRPAADFVSPGSTFLFYTYLDVPRMSAGNLPQLNWFNSQKTISILNLPPYLHVEEPGLGLIMNGQSAKAYFQMQLTVARNKLPLRAEIQKDAFHFAATPVQVMVQPSHVFSLMSGLSWFKSFPTVKLLRYFVNMVLTSFELILQLSNWKVKCLRTEVTSSLEEWHVGSLVIKPVLQWNVGADCGAEEAELKVKGRIKLPGFAEMELDITDGFAMEGSFVCENDQEILLLETVLAAFVDVADLQIPSVFSFPVKQLNIQVGDPTRGDYNLKIYSLRDIVISDRFILREPVLDLQAFSYEGDHVLKVAFGGKLQVGSIDFDVTVRKEDKGWVLSGATADQVALTDIVNDWPFPDVSASRITVNFLITDRPDQSSYQLQAEFPWQLDFGFLQIIGDAKLTVNYDQSVTGKVEATVKIRQLGAEVLLTYHLGGENKFTVKWEDFTADYFSDRNSLSFNLSNWSFDQLLTSLMKMTGKPYYSLPEPFDRLLGLKGKLNVWVHFYLDTGKVSVEGDLNVETKWFTINGFALTKERDSEKCDHVWLSLDTTLPNAPKWDIADPNSQPNVDIPGFAQLFELRWLGLGQRVSMTSMVFDSVDDAVQKMKDAFKKSPTCDDPTLQYDPASNWLIGTDFGLIKYKAGGYFLNMQLVFNDPKLYGLRLSLDGELASLLKGLEFEIKYSKVSDSKGVYSAEITLPDEMRFLQFPPLTIILPVFAIKIYTNGDFEVDIGFPHNLDFSRSFAIQAPPYYAGAGGFYIAKLSGDTSTRAPKAKNGSFDQVLEFGLGMALGVGRDFHKGILKAGFNVSAVGVFEGVLATFHPNDPNEPKERYFKVAAMLGVIGRLYGSVDFGVIKGDVNVAIDLVIRTTIAAFAPLDLEIRARVDVYVSYKIKLGFVKITINLAFNAELNESVTVGGGGDAPWDLGSTVQPLLEASSILVDPEWKKLPSNSSTVLKAYFVPQLTVDQTMETNDYQAYYVAMLYLHAGAFQKLADNVFLWVLQAFGQDLSDSNPHISKEKICQACCWFTQENHGCPIDYADLVNNLLSENVKIEIHELNQACSSEEGLVIESVTVFPMIPELVLRVPAYNGSEPINVDFKTHFCCTPDYLSVLHKHFEQLRVRYLSNMDKEQPNKTFVWSCKEKSMATLLFEDYFVLVAKQLLQHALDVFAGQSSPTMTWDELKKKLEEGRHYDSVAALGTHFMLSGMRPPAHAKNVQESDHSLCQSLQEKQPVALYCLSGQQFALPELTIATDCDTYGIRLAKGRENSDWIEFVGADSSVKNEICLALQQCDIDRIRELLTVAPNSVGMGAAVEAIPMMRQVPKWYSLTNNIPIASSMILYEMIWPFPNSLLGLVARSRTLVPSICQGVSKDGKCKDTLKPEEYKLGTLLNVSVKRLSKSDNNTELNNLYELIGTDEAGTTLLERLLEAKVTTVNPEVFIMYPKKEGQTGGLTYKEQTKFIVKSNLSTETNPPRSLGENLQETDEWIQWLWECSIVRSGGFYLYYKEKDGGEKLPDHLFDEEGIGRIRVVLCYPQETMDSYVNCLLTVKVNQESLYLSAQQNKSYQIKPGDTLGAIATQCELTVLELARLAEEIPLRQVSLMVPGERAIDVFSGKCLKTIASKYSVSVEWLAWHNRNVKDIFEPNWLDLSVLLQDKMATMPMGNVGFRLKRNNPGEAENMTTYLEEQYRLLGYRVTENADFCQSEEGLPVALEGYLTEWQYQKVLPVYPFAKFNPLQCVGQSQEGNRPDPNLNPYAGIGSTARIGFFWQDSFGNRIAPGPNLEYLDIELGYTDRLIGFDQWPGFTLRYYFEQQKENRKLVLDLTFDTERYKCPERAEEIEKWKERVLADRLAYAKIYYQLCQTDPNGNQIICFKVQTSLDQHKEHWLTSRDTAAVLQFVIGNYQYLDCLLQSRECSALAQKLQQILSFDVCDANPQDVFELDVSFTILRPIELVDIQFKDDNSVSTAATYVQPLMEPAVGEGITEPKERSLKYFAISFEQVFNFADYCLKIATGMSRFGSTGSDANKIWAVRLSKTQSSADLSTCSENRKGISYCFYPEPVFFAPLPLSKNLISRAVQVQDFDPGSAELKVDKTQIFERVDMDQWARQYLEAVEEVLSPSIAVNAFKVASDTYKEILKIKQCLADTIPKWIDSVLEISKDPVLTKQVVEQLKVDAGEKLRQQLLIKLTNAYDIETLVAFKATVQSSFLPNDASSISPRLYGGIVAKPRALKELATDEQKAETAYSMSNGKVILVNGDSSLSFIFNARSAEYQSNFTLDLDYQIQYIEHEIGSVEGNYQASSWLGFVIPLEPISLGTCVKIPIPLRAYPPEPNLLSHEGIPLVQEGEKETTLQKAVQWAYQYDYTRAHAAQDRLESQVLFNVQKEAQVLLTEEDLFNKLARFIHAYPNIQKVLKEEPTDANGDRYQKALKIFRNLIQAVADTWEAWFSTQSSLLLTHSALEYYFGISQEPHGKEPLMKVTITPIKCLQDESIIPKLVIEQYQCVEACKVPDIYDPDQAPPGVRVYFYYKIKDDGKREYLTWCEGLKIQKRTVRFDNLNVLVYQNVWPAMKVIRNDKLIEDRITNKRFVYETPFVRFAEKLTPLLDIYATIRVAQIGSTGSGSKVNPTLEKHIYNLFEALFTGVGPFLNNYEYLKRLIVKVEDSYQYPLEQQVHLPINLPISLLLPSEFCLAVDQTDPERISVDAKYICNIVSAIEQWVNTNRPPDGQYRYDLSVFSSLNETKLPLLRLHNLILDHSEIELSD